MPWVTVKVGLGLDGSYRNTSGSSTRTWYSSPQSRKHSHLLRARSCAIVVSYRTYLKDKPRLTARIASPVVQPKKIVLDPHAVLKRSLLLGADSSDLILYCGIHHKEDGGAAERGDIRYLPVTRQGEFCMSDLLKDFSRRHYNEVLFECGASLFRSLLSASAIDELVLYQSTKISQTPSPHFFYAIQDSDAAFWEEHYALASMRRMGDSDSMVVYRKRESCLLESLA